MAERDGRVASRSFRSGEGHLRPLCALCRFRVFQLTAFGDRDYGIETLERFSGRVAAAGLSGERSGIYAHLFMEFIITTAYGAAHHIFPKEHREFLEEKTAK